MPIDEELTRFLATGWRRRRLGGSLFKYVPGKALPPGAAISRSTTGTYFDQNGVVQTAAINTLRDGHYIGGVRTTLLEGAATNSVLWSRDLTNAAWTKRGVCAVAKTATGADGAANSATAVTGLGATGVDDVYQAVGGLTASVRYEPSFMFQKVSSTGTIIIKNPGVGGQWTLDLSLLGTGWTRITRSHPAVTVNTDFSSTAGNQGGIWFVASTGGPLSFNVDFVQWELGTFSTSPIFTTTAAVTRGADMLTFPLTNLPGAHTAYFQTIPLGYLGAGGRFGEFTQSGMDANPRLIYGYLTDNANAQGYWLPSTGVNSGTVPLPAVNVSGEIRQTFDATGVVQIGSTTGGSAETLSTLSAAGGPLVIPASPVLALGAAPNMTQVGFFAFQKVVIAAGIRSLAEMRNL